MNTETPAVGPALKHAVIYCRVGTFVSAQPSGALISQEERCRMYARLHGYNVIGVFKDWPTTGSGARREGMRDLLKLLRSQKRGTVVIADEIARFGRSTEMYFRVITDIKKAGGGVETEAALPKSRALRKGAALLEGWTQ